MENTVYTLEIFFKDYPGKAWPQIWPIRQLQPLSFSEKITRMLNPLFLQYAPTVAKHCHDYYTVKHSRWENTIIFTKRILVLLYNLENGKLNKHIIQEILSFKKLLHRGKQYTKSQLQVMIHKVFHTLEVPDVPIIIPFHFGIYALAWSNLCSTFAEPTLISSETSMPVSIYDSFEITLDQFVMVFHSLMYSIIRIASEHLYLLLQDSIPKQFTLFNTTERKTPFCAYYVDFALLWVAFADVINGLNSGKFNNLTHSLFEFQQYCWSMHLYNDIVRIQKLRPKLHFEMYLESVLLMYNCVVSLVTLFLRLPSAKQYLISTYIVEQILGYKIENAIQYPWTFPITPVLFDAYLLPKSDIKYFLCVLKLLASDCSVLSESITKDIFWSKLKINIQLEPMKKLSWTLNFDEFKEYRNILLARKKHYEEKKINTILETLNSI